MVAISPGMSAAVLRSVNESLRDDLARLRVLADAVRTSPGRADDLRVSCRSFCDAVLVRQESKRLHLYPGLPEDVVDRLADGHRHIVVQLARIRHAEVTEVHVALTDLAGLLETLLRVEEDHGGVTE